MLQSFPLAELGSLPVQFALGSGLIAINQFFNACISRFVQKAKTGPGPTPDVMLASSNNGSTVSEDTVCSERTLTDPEACSSLDA